MVNLHDCRHLYSAIICHMYSHGHISDILFLLIYSQTCAGLEPPDSKTFYDVSVPEIIQTLLMVAEKLQAKFIKTSDVGYQYLFYLYGQCTWAEMVLA